MSELRSVLEWGTGIQPRALRRGRLIGLLATLSDWKRTGCSPHWKRRTLTSTGLDSLPLAGAGRALVKTRAWFAEAVFA